MSHWRERPLCVLGSTGSVGVNTLAVAVELGVPVHALSARSRIADLAAQVLAHRPQLVALPDAKAAAELRERLGGQASPEILVGAEALPAIAAHPGSKAVLTAVVGAAGLPATLAAVRAGKRVCIANKEPLVMAGALIMAEALRHGAEILPVDSEHAAIFQCLRGRQPREIREIIITGSGGPLREVKDLSTVTREQALRHPTWRMGPKITIDSATMMNKALEVIEAHHLFALPVGQIKVLIHPQSIVHGAVILADGTLLAQLGVTDMKLPIRYALTHPVHEPGGVAAPDLATLATLQFAAPDRTRFPALDLGYAAARRGGLAPTVLNAANEVAVARFLAGQCSFLDIAATVADAVARAPHVNEPDLAAILAADAEVRVVLDR